MNVAVAGKGGVGKTVVAGTVARSFAGNGTDVLAVDADDDPDLAVSLGAAREEVTPLPNDLLEHVDREADEAPDWELTRSPATIVDEYGVATPSGVTMLRAGSVSAGEGGFGYAQVTAYRLFCRGGDERSQVTVVDMPAGLGVPGLAQPADALLLVVEPSYPSLETIRKLNEYAVEFEVPDVRVVVNGIRDDADLAFVEDYLADRDLAVSTVVPDDEAVRRAERQGTALATRAEDSPAVDELASLADDLAERHDLRDD